ncbi:rhomboid family intramembrane serine protease [Halorientalis brevis]|uniref:Rhomboid family intramembrane serine protease n=1 Tax=Halorientalis brevis TaxID=1126241 RepID=A0ABD6CHM0_9EURY|nr:rhomboid family intramembrane serine protease [Halorientalis brevis]
MGALQFVVGPAWLPVWPMLVCSGVLLSLGIALRIARPQGAWGRRLRSRFFLGIPWGSLLTLVGVGGVYLFLQGGLAHPRRPLVIPFRAWSYFYPFGIVTAPFTHAGLAHVTGNLMGTLAFAPIAEYAWSHFPTARGSQSFSGWRANPFVRILVFPVVVFVVGLLTGVFAVGPVIGFSGVVFAFAGFALVSYPITTVVALSGMQVLNLVYRAMLNPVTTAQAGPGGFSAPWWSQIAIQGHALGLLLGVLLGAYVAYRRDRTPTAGRLWIATVIFVVAQSLWAVYWFRGGGKYVLFRAVGAFLVFLLAALVTAAVTASSRTLVGPIDLRSREAAIGLLISVTLAISVAAVPVNLVTVSEEPFDASVDVEDYTVTYAEDVEDQYVSAFDVSLLGETTDLNTSGVIVVSERRSIFQTVVSKTRLAYNGRARVVVGGPGWRETVVVNRTGWQAAGNSSVYKVFLNPSDGDRRLAFQSKATTIEPRIAGRRILIQPTATSFNFTVIDENQTVGTTAVPAPGANVTAGGLRFNRTDKSVFVERKGTKVRVARKERS